MGRAPCCDKTKVKRGPWSPEEDNTLKNYVQKYGTGGNWIALPHKAGLKRCGKSCRLRWLNYLRPDIKHGGFTEEEDNVILALYTNIGSRWSVIASKLPGRTDNDVKNYWNTKLKKKLLAAATEPQIRDTTAVVPINDINANINCALNNMDFCLTTSLAPFNEVQANYLGNSTYPTVMQSDTLPHSMGVIQGYPEVVPGMLYESSTDQFPLPGLTEVQENGTPYDALITTSSSGEISSLSPSYSQAKSYASWTDNGIGGKMGFFVELESKSSNYGHHQNTEEEEIVIGSAEDDHSGLLVDYAYPMGSFLANISDNAASQSIS